MDAVAQNEASPVERDVGEAQTEGYRWVGVGEVEVVREAGEGYVGEKGEDGEEKEEGLEEHMQLELVVIRWGVWLREERGLGDVVNQDSGAGVGSGEE